MSIFKINILDMYWIKEGEESNRDLCLHGRVFVSIGDEIVADNYDCTISSTALYLLKSLTNNHHINNMANKMLPCCGHCINPMDDGTVEILGCSNGIDWDVIHIDNSIIIKSMVGTQIVLTKNEYQKIVIRFTDEVENFYKESDEKVLPKDDYDSRGYIQFWKEWHDRRYNLI